MRIIVDHRPYANGEVIDIIEPDESEGPAPTEEHFLGFCGDLPY
ncbi:hypothetical protein [Spirillospora sp. CA-128828]